MKEKFDQNDILEFFKAHNKGLILAWYAWTVLSYFVIREFKIN